MDKGATDGTRKRTPDSSIRVVLIEISKRHEKFVLVKLIRPSIHRTSNMYTQCCQFQNCKRKIEVHYYEPLPNDG